MIIRRTILLAVGCQLLSTFLPARAETNPPAVSFPSTNTTSASSVAFDEWYGPFPSWTNVMAFGAFCNGVSNDDVAVSNALAAVGLNGCSPVLYFPGPCLITKKMWLASRVGVQLVGIDPTRTYFIWGGGSNGTYSGASTMLHMDGCADCSIERLGFDGRNKAVSIISCSQSTSATVFDNNNVFIDCIIKNGLPRISHGIDGGYYDRAFANEDFVRCTISNVAAGVVTWNYNAIDCWLTRCRMMHCSDEAAYIWQGCVHPYQTTFISNGVDYVAAHNSASTFYSLVGNSSFGSGQFLELDDQGHNISSVLIKGNTVSHMNSINSACLIGQVGPVFALDNVFATSNSAPSFAFINSANLQMDFLAIGNTNAASSWYSVDSGLGQKTNLVDNYTVPTSNLTLTVPPPPTPATNLNRTVIEIPTNFTAASLQTAITKAVNGAVIHIPWANNVNHQWSMLRTVTIPSNKDVRIVGDGYYAALVWNGEKPDPMFTLPHPSHATFSHLRFYGPDSGALVGVTGVGTNTARVYVRDSSVASSYSANFRLGDCPNTVIESYGRNNGNTDAHLGANAILDGRGKIKLVNTDGGQDLLGFVCTNGGQLYVETTYGEAGTGFSNHVFLVSGNSTITFLAGRRLENVDNSVGESFKRATTNGFTVSNFSGQLLFAGIQVIDWFNITNNSTGSVWINGNNTYQCPTNIWPIANSTTNVPVQTMNWNYNAGFSRYADVGTPSAAYTRRLYGPARTEYIDLAPMTRPINQTAVFIDQCFIENGRPDIGVFP